MESRSESGHPQPAGAAPRRSPGRRRYLFIGLILAVLFGMQEVLFRFMFPVPEALFNRVTYKPPPTLFAEDPETRSKALCNVIIRWECEPDGMAFDHTLNLYGFRGPDFALAPPADRPRILFVGDSYTEGCGAADDETVPRQFAGLIAEDAPAEVLNLGIAAADFPEYLRLMRDAVPLLRPHTVFLVTCWNDLPVPGSHPDASPESAPQAIPTLSPYLPRAVEAISLLYQGWSLPRRWHSGPFPFFAAVPDPSNPFSRLPFKRKSPAGRLDPALERAMRAGKANPNLAGLLPSAEKRLRLDYDVKGGAESQLLFLEELCRRHDVRLKVIYVPYHVAANPAYLPAQVRLGGCAGLKLPASFSDEAHRTQQRHFARVCRDAGIAFVDMTDAFIARERERRLYWPIDGHCNAAGNRLIAEACARCWTADRWVPKP